MTYTVHPVPPRKGEPTCYSVRDGEDNAVGFSYIAENALLIGVALNLLARHDPLLFEVDWTCGHRARGVCAQCHGELIKRANKLAAELNGDAPKRKKKKPR